MAGSRILNAIGPSYRLADTKAACQSAINCYPQRLDGDNLMMASAPGEVLFCGLPADVRGLRDVEGRLFAVAGGTLYEITSNGTATARGTLASSAGFVGMAHNRTQLTLVDGAMLYVFALETNTLTTISAAGWRGSDDVHELDGYMIFVDPGSDQFYISAIDDSADLNALDFSSADSAPDNIITHRVMHRQLWLFGTTTTELWIDSGALAFPFTRYSSYTLDVGIVGKRAAIVAADTLWWIGQTRAGRGLVYTASGNQPQRVSTIAVEQALAASTDLSAATMWAYQVEGHEFIAINAPGLTSTWVYDAALQMWHERAEWADGWAPLRAAQHVAFNGQIYAADGANIVRLDTNTHTLSGRPLVRERTWPHMVQSSMEPITFRGVEVSMRSGAGGVATLQVSNDGGQTFGPPLLRSLGAVGRWMQRVRWLRLGAAYNRVFRLRVADPVPFALYTAVVDA
jgi:Phage stabilisation protein